MTRGQNIKDPQHNVGSEKVDHNIVLGIFKSNCNSVFNTNSNSVKFNDMSVN